MNPLTDINAINIKQNKTKQNCEHIYMELTYDRTIYIIYTYITMNDTDQTINSQSTHHRPSRVSYGVSFGITINLNDFEIAYPSPNFNDETV